MRRPYDSADDLARTLAAGHRLLREQRQTLETIAATVARLEEQAPETRYNLVFLGPAADPPKAWLRLAVCADGQAVGRTRSGAKGQNPGDLWQESESDGLAG